jgi:hypothetical protein
MMIVIKQSTAQKQNARFNQKTSHFVSLQERIDALIAANPGDDLSVKQAKKKTNQELTKALEKFKEGNPNFMWSNVRLVRAQSTTLDKIFIDDTMNRPLVWKHIIKIIKNFKQTKIMAINVYEDPDKPGCYIAWDGQHTAVVLYILSVIYDLQSIATVVAPIAIYDVKSKAEIRENFIVLNSDEGKEKLSPLALITNKIFGVRIDGSTNPDWVLANKKQLALESADLFMTDETLEDEPGAITHVKEIDKASLELVQSFCEYWKARSTHNVAIEWVEGKEQILMCQFLQLCLDQGIDVTDQYASDMVNIMYNKFQCNWQTQQNANPFFMKVNRAYKNFFKKSFLNDAEYDDLTDEEKEALPPYLDMLATTNTKQQDPYYVAFLIAQLKYSKFSHTLPTPGVHFKIAAKDLW